MLYARPKLFFATALLFALSFFHLQGQSSLFLSNPSFEGLPRQSTLPPGWSDCASSPGESAPDTQPDRVGGFMVYKEAFDGSTYIGMVVRDNDTWEAVGQQLSAPMVKAQCYEMSVKLARSDRYYSVSRKTDLPIQYIQPIKLRIWGGYGVCDRRAMLGETGAVAHMDWKQYHFKFKPTEGYTHIVLEAFYVTPVLVPYCGNILVDDLSLIQPLDCNKPVPQGPQTPKETDTPLIAAAPRTPTVTPVPNPRTGNPTTNPPAQQTREATIGGVKRSELSTGETIVLDAIQFEADSARIISSVRPTVDELFRFMEANRDVSIEVGGHTNSLASTEYANTLSTARAKAVADYLVGKGISRSRVTYKGYGKSNPIASNETPEGRRKNQRVEIKIIRIGGSQ